MKRIPKPHLKKIDGKWLACYGYARGAKWFSTLIIASADTAEDAFYRYWISGNLRQLHPEVTTDWMVVPVSVTKNQGDAVAALFREGFMDKHMIDEIYRAFLENSPAQGGRCEQKRH